LKVRQSSVSQLPSLTVSLSVSLSVGTAILVAVLLVALVTSGNNYTKELQFRALEKSSQRDERCSVLRNGVIDRINPIDIVVGDILILQVPPLFTLTLSLSDSSPSGG
jgi:magnesium-transporting ATPase (P-type)